MHPKFVIKSAIFPAIFFVAFSCPAVGQEQLVNCYVNCNATFKFGESIRLPSSCARQRLTFCAVFAYIDFVNPSIWINLESLDLSGLPPDLSALALGIKQSPLGYAQRTVIYRSGSFRSFELYISSYCDADESCALNFVDKRIQNLVKKLNSSMAQFWTSVDDVVGSSLTVNPNILPSECYQSDGGKIKCESYENRCELERIAVVGDIMNLLNVTIPPAKAGCSHETDDSSYIEIQTTKMEPATSQFSYQNVVIMKCLKSLCNGGDSLNKLNQLLRTTFPILEVDLPNAKPTSASNRIIQEIHLGYLPLLVLSILNYLLN